MTKAETKLPVNLKEHMVGNNGFSIILQSNATANNN